MTCFHAPMCSRLEVLVRKMKTLIIKKIYMQWQYDRQKAQIEHMTQISSMKV